MTHSAGQKGYKISSSAANRDHRRYSDDAREREDQSMLEESPAAGSGVQASAQGWDRNAESEGIERQNK